MDKPSNESPDNAPPTSAGGQPLRKVVMLDPGFREELEPSVLRPRILGIKPPAHPKDLRNLKFAVIALIVSGVLFGILEYKQLREAAHDVKSSAKEFFDSK